MPKQQISDDDFRNNFNTKLSDEDELKFQNWLVNSIIKYKTELDKDLDSYDLRGFWKESDPNDLELFAQRKIHAIDKYKKPNHPTFSNESIYHGRLYQGGSWEYKNGKEIFHPTKFQLELQKILSKARNANTGGTK